MATTTHLRTTHIDALVDEEFDYVKVPQDSDEAMVPEKERARTAIIDVNITPEGLVPRCA